MADFDEGYTRYICDRKNEEKMKTEERARMENEKQMLDIAVHIIMTGGTIDSYYEGVLDTVIPNRESEIPAYVAGLKLHSKVAFTQVCMKDSRSLNQDDLMKVLAAIESSPISRIILTHGTYTMPDTARFLKKNLKSRKTVVLTGSMKPLNMPSADAGFNLGFAYSKVYSLGPGVYVCMNGCVFDPDRVEKIIPLGMFAES